MREDGGDPVDVVGLHYKGKPGVAIVDPLVISSLQYHPSSFVKGSVAATFRFLLLLNVKIYDAFLTIHGLVWQTRLPQEWTNSVFQFLRIMGRVHYRQIPLEVRRFEDDCGIIPIKQ
jgi:hypothetical protein